ncbi:hypothetical protein CEW46_27525 [Bacillus cereus]|nr:hypothetical protein CEW46_27525 [Bacillus cereus]
MHQYQLEIVRYQETENSCTMRSEFPMFEKDKAVTMEQDLNDKGYHFVERKTITIRNGRETEEG